MTMPRISALAVTAALAALVATGCSGTATAPETAPSGSSAPATGPVQGPAIVITALNFGDPLTVSPGEQITIVNNDDVAHTVTSKIKGLFDIHVAGNARTLFSAPTEPGRYPYYCVYYPGMIGLLVVR
jgi:plastocyanin